MALDRQLEELDALAAVFSEDGEFSAAEDVALARSSLESGQPAPPNLLACEVCLRLHEDGTSNAALPSAPVAALSFTLPRDYPADAPPILRLSAPQLGKAAHAALEAAVLAAVAAGAGRECLLDACFECQRRGAELVAEQAATEPVAAAHDPPAARPSATGRRIVWFHHVKSLEKRKSIVGWARDAAMRGFLKPGFPGVLVVEGDDAEVAALLVRLRALRWQAMEVRWEQTLPGPPSPAAGQLPLPFVELAESAMGEAAAHCEAAGLLAAFRGAVLKLPG